MSTCSATTKGWTRVKEGYLLKNKGAHHKGGKLRYFVLFQHPVTRHAQLEYYFGQILRGAIDLLHARAIPLPEARFELHASTQVLYLQAEQSDLEAAATWTFELQRIIDEMETANPSDPRGSIRADAMAGACVASCCCAFDG